MVQPSAESYLVAVDATQTRSGRESDWGGEHVAVPASLVGQLEQRRRALQRTQLFRLVEFIGRWSMLDIYVVALTVTLVQVGTLASIAVGPGALAFGAVVVVTMVAAHTFDPRLIWDAAGDARE